MGLYRECVQHHDTPGERLQISEVRAWWKLGSPAIFLRCTAFVHPLLLDRGNASAQFLVRGVGRRGWGKARFTASC